VIFEQASLAFFAVCAFAGMAATCVLAASARKPHLAVLAWLIAVWAVAVLTVAAVSV